MSLEFDWVEITIPPDFRDLSDYTFRVGEEREQVAVAYHPAPQGLEAVYKERRAQILDQTAVPLRLVAEGEASLGGQPARTLSFTFEDSGERLMEDWVLALCGEDEAVLLSYLRPAGLRRKGLPEWLVGGASFELQEAEAPRGFRQHPAGRLSLLLPERFEPPRAYSFAPPEGKAQVSMRLYPPGTKAPVRTLEKEIEVEAYSATIEILQRGSVEVRGGGGEQVFYRLDDKNPLEPFSIIGRRAHLRLGGGNVHLHARTDPTEEEGLDTLWESLLVGIVGLDGAV